LRLGQPSLGLTLISMQDVGRCEPDEPDCLPPAASDLLAELDGTSSVPT
jgi:hypothetical protein